VLKALVESGKFKKAIIKVAFSPCKTALTLGVDAKDILPSHKIGRKRVFLKEDLIQWIKEH